MPVKDLLEGLDDEQVKAVTLQSNGVIAAGAGSGKTRVLASRYAWLITEKKLRPEEILTLTFTNKAVSEMYSRIYRYLLERAGGEANAAPDSETMNDEDERAGGFAVDRAAGRAASAIREFHKARIGTLDSFSANIARTAAARYGISPDFTSDDTALRDLAREAALVFVLDHRENPALRQLLVDHKIRKLAEELFALVVREHSPISSPLKPDSHLTEQKETLLQAWKEKTRQLEEITESIIGGLRVLAELKKSIGLTKALGELLLKVPAPAPPDISPLLETGPADKDQAVDAPPLTAKTRLKNYFDYYSALAAIRLPGNYGEVYEEVVGAFKRFKGKDGDGLYHELESIANCALNFGVCAGVFELIKQFQDEFNEKKRETGFLSFNDIAHLAVDALKEHPDIRKAYKESLRMIMIDEFQDNNALQRDLIYLLAENPGRAEKGIAPPDELEKDRVFFVGDEKQSIYRFRGADVTVFRSLGQDLPQADSVNLLHNYRSRPGLIAAFNHIFRQVFSEPGSGVLDFEAAYSPIFPPGGSDEGDGLPLAHFCFLKGDDLPGDDAGGLTSQDLEAVFIAKKIRDMVMSRERIPKNGEEVECAWGDFAVLERSYTHQSTLEKYFREFGVPYTTDRPSGLFNDAPILDLRAYLRLLVYPEDRIAYAALIRSPFTRLSDLCLAVCMLNDTGEPFGEENEALIPEDELELYRQARERYRALREICSSIPLTELIARLWFEEGYRYETLWNESAQVYEGLFDLFFSLAADAESRGKNLAEFIEYLEDVMNREEKPDDQDLPGEGEAGVRILSIHKSKGLEFPVVFIYDCAHSGNIRASAELVSFHEKYGLILNIPQAEELPLGGNYFRRILAREEKAKDIAELKRLLYVAMTRAESRLFLTFTLPKQTQKEKEAWDARGAAFNDETIRRRLEQLSQKPEGKETFLTLLQDILVDCPPSLCALEGIPILSRAEIAGLAAGKSPAGGETLSQRDAALAAAPFYQNARILEPGKAGPQSLRASELRYRPGASPFFDPGIDEDSPLDRLLEKAGLEPADFGSLVHGVLEGRLNGRLWHIPARISSRAGDEETLQKLMSQAEEMANRFLASELGQRWSASSQREPEFPVISSVTIEGKTVAILGQMDLLFEEDHEAVVVDFKTDKTENPEDHFGQFAAYYRAAGDISGKPVSLWIAYLRSGRLVNVTEAVKGLSLEEIAARALSGMPG